MPLRRQQSLKNLFLISNPLSARIFRGGWLALFTMVLNPCKKTKAVLFFMGSTKAYLFKTRTFWSGSWFGLWIWLRLKSFKTRTFWFWSFRTFWLRLNRGEVVVDNNVVGGEMVDNERSGSPETTCWLMNSFETRTFWSGSWFGFWIWLRLQSFKTRTFWFWSLRTFWLRWNRGEVVVADNVNAVIVVDDDQSGLPETIRLCENGPLAWKQLLYSKEI